jgi:Flp pilus assembly protein TadG
VVTKRCGPIRKLSGGQSAVELAMMAPVLLTLLLAVGDYARVFFKSIEVADAARAGALYGAQNLTKAVDNTGIKNAAVTDAADIALTTANVTPSTYCTCTGSTTPVTCGPSTCTWPASEKIFLTVTVSATFTTSFIWGITVGGHYMGLPSSTALTSTSVLEVQQ